MSLIFSSLVLAVFGQYVFGQPPGFATGGGEIPPEVLAMLMRNGGSNGMAGIFNSQIEVDNNLQPNFNKNRYYGLLVVKFIGQGIWHSNQQPAPM